MLPLAHARGIFTAGQNGPGIRPASVDLFISLFNTVAKKDNFKLSIVIFNAKILIPTRLRANVEHVAVHKGHFFPPQKFIYHSQKKDKIILKIYRVFHCDGPIKYRCLELYIVIGMTVVMAGTKIN